MSDLDAKIGELDAESPERYPDTFRQNPTNNGIFDRKGYAWAEDIYWVSRHMSSRVTKKNSPNDFCWEMLKYAKKDPERFVSHIMPKAMSLLERAREKAGDNDDVVNAEEKSIADLRNLLKAAVKESEQITV